MPSSPKTPQKMLYDNKVLFFEKFTDASGSWTRLKDVAQVVVHGRTFWTQRPQRVSFSAQYPADGLNVLDDTAWAGDLQQWQPHFLKCESSGMVLHQFPDLPYKLDARS